MPRLTLEADGKWPPPDILRHRGVELGLGAVGHLIGEERVFPDALRGRVLVCVWLVDPRPVLMRFPLDIGPPGWKLFVEGGDEDDALAFTGDSDEDDEDPDEDDDGYWLQPPGVPPDEGYDEDDEGDENV
jgi:hypothetical protein